MSRAFATWSMWLGRAARVVAALAGLAALTVGVPALLLVLAGPPTGLTVSLTQRLNDTATLHIVAIVGWLLWLRFLLGVVAEIVLTVAEAADARHGRPRPRRRRSVDPVRVVAAVLVGTIAGAIAVDLLRGAFTTTPGLRAEAAPAPPAAVAVALVESPRTVSAPTSGYDVQTAPVVHRGEQPPGWARDAPGGAYHVVKGDNQWDIAATQLGDPFRWREIHQLSNGQPQADGHTLTDPDRLHIGWWLALPAPHPTNPTTSPDTTPPADVGQPPPTIANTDPRPDPPTASAPGASTVTPSPTLPSTAPPTATAAPSAAPVTAADDGHAPTRPGVDLPSQTWISLGLAALIASVAVLLRLHQRRRARLTFPIPTHLNPTPGPVPDSLRPADEAGARLLTPATESTLSTVMPAPPAVRAPIGVDAHGNDISLFTQPGIALHGDGAIPAARAILAAVLCTGVVELAWHRPIVVTTTDTLAQLLPPGTPPVGLGTDSFDGERLHIVNNTAGAVTRLEEQMIYRRRFLDTQGVDSLDAVHGDAFDDDAEVETEWVLLVHHAGRAAARIDALAGQATALRLYPVVLGDTHTTVPHYTVAKDGTVTTEPDRNTTPPVAKFSTLAAADVPDVISLVRAVAPRPEPGTDFETAADTPEADTLDTDLFEIADAVAATPTATAPVHLHVLGPITLGTDAGPIATGLRSGSLSILALLTVHPKGLTLDEIIDNLFRRKDNQLAAKTRTDINALRKQLRDATGLNAMFINFRDTNRYRIEPEHVDVDLWQMLAALDRANRNPDDDTACLAALHEAVAHYHGDFAAHEDQPWITEYAATFRHQYLSALSRIAEILEPDQPDQAIAALNKALDHDPVNEELYQRLMRIHGRRHRPDDVRRLMSLLEQRLFDLGQAEPSDATRRIAARQLHTARNG